MQPNAAYAAFTHGSYVESMDIFDEKNPQYTWSLTLSQSHLSTFYPSSNVTQLVLYCWERDLLALPAQAPGYQSYHLKNMVFISIKENSETSCRAWIFHSHSSFHHWRSGKRATINKLRSWKASSSLIQLCLLEPSLTTGWHPHLPLAGPPAWPPSSWSLLPPVECSPHIPPALTGPPQFLQSQNFGGSMDKSKTTSPYV